MFKIDRVIKVSASSTAKDVELHCQPFLIQNLSTEETAYFKEKDGVACTASNGFALPPGKMTLVPMVARTLSIVATASSTDVRILVGD